MGKIRGGIGQIDISSNPMFDPLSGWVITIPGWALPDDGQIYPEPQVQTVALADGRNVNVGYTVEFSIRVKGIGASDLQYLKNCENDDAEVWVRYSSADLASDGTTPKLVKTIKRAILTRVTDINLVGRPGLCAAIIEGNAAGAKEEDVIDTVITL